MTSMAAESATTILCTAQQTRFHIDSPNYRELHVQGLHILVTSGGKDSSTPKTRSKRPDGLEILSNAKLLLKEGRRYALVGRNGTGKSTLLRAIADKLIPGIPEGTRIAILQQTKLMEDDGDEKPGEGHKPQASVLQEVIDRATAQDTIEQEIKALSEGVDASDPLGPVRALRSLKHHRLQKRLFRMDKEARLRSGARGVQARKALVAFEKVVAESDAMINQSSDDISPGTRQAETQEAADMLAELQIHLEPSRIAQTETRARSVMAGLGFTEERMRKPVSSMSGGWHMRAALAAALLQDADLLILDEPTNFLDLLGIVWLQRYLQRLAEGEQPPTVIIVSHDRDFMSVCTDLMLLKDKKLTYFHGDLPTYEASQAQRKLWLRKMKAAQAKRRAHMEKTIAQNIKAGKANDDGNKIRQAKSRQKKLDDRMGMQVNAKGHRFKLNRDLVGYSFTRREDIDIPADERPVVMALPEPPDLRSPGSLVSLDGASYRYGPRLPLVVDSISLTVGMGDRIGILGLNGSGKTTLIRMLVGESRPTTGSATTHPRLRLGYYSQHAVEALKALGKEDSTLTALGLLTREVDGQMGEGEIRGLLGELGLPGRIASDTPVCKLSGGQLVRCELARLFWKRPHCLILDEVTTHLDYETATALRIAVYSWDGAVVLVSHDRWFLRGAVEGNLGADSDDSEQSDDDGDDGDAPRRRIMYRLKGGNMTALDGGVDEFEKSMERKVNKLLVQ
ncbi:ABC transporter-like protein [Metarhizium album ARSEF 1941]|uniref:ABC transporter-like protein n=1 Tax=Metarhizium album (strain ARSEF 1941) TaxID=1081103 RepID=A0A0B2WWS2_METAS|nr:ABC transporter-like protein [Metarhizium album ARSEF 1941]KHN98059.1 ABC transporter-like protein [Metarhizium album ARSEF 1941]